MRSVTMSLGLLLISAAAPRTASAQLEIGTWTRKATDTQPAMTMKIEPCCGGKGRKLSYTLNSTGTALSLTLDSKLDGSEAPVMMNGTASGETMAIKRVDARHVTNVLKINGTKFATSVATLSADGKTLTVVTDVSTAMAGMQVGKTTEVWIKQ